MLIPSFSVDHRAIVPGIFVSRVDRVGSGTVTTYDVRLTRPNKEPAVDVAAMHSLEHIIATFLRNDPDWKEEIVYWGPMGCLTGNYLLMRGDLQPEDILPLMRDTFRFVAGYEGEVPGAAPSDCGNWRLHDLPKARQEAEKYLREVLEVMGPENMHYPEK